MLPIGFLTLLPIAAALAVVLWTEMRLDIGRKRRDLLSERITQLRKDFDARSALVDLRLTAIEKRETARITGRLPLK